MTPPDWTIRADRPVRYCHDSKLVRHGDGRIAGPVRHCHVVVEGTDITLRCVRAAEFADGMVEALVLEGAQRGLVYARGHIFTPGERYCGH
jgi:hypothetical protein